MAIDPTAMQAIVGSAAVPPQLIDQPGVPMASALPQQPPKYHDVTVTTSKKYQCAKVEAVPPEEFGIERSARSIRDANYCFHKVLVSEAKLIGQGFDADQVKNLPTYAAVTNQEEIKRDSVDEQELAGDEMNSAARLIEVTEHYIRMDYEGDGKAKLYRVTTAGGSDEIMTRDGKPDIVPFDAMPFAAMTPVIIPHRFFGRSIADLIMDIQRIKTALTRGMLDNMYLALNPQKVVARAGSTSETIDDLLVARPNGIIRVEQQGAVENLVSPDVSGFILPALGYFDSTREFRTGVTRQGQGVDADALQNQSATAVNQLYTAAQARMKLIARIFAETGIRDMFLLLHGVIRKHSSQPQTVRLRNQWVNIDPRQWKARNDMTVHVGLGSGGKQEQLQQIMAIMNVQKEMVLGGLTNVVTPANLYASAKELTRAVGHKDIDAFFTNPANSPPPQPPPNPEVIKAQIQQQQQQQQFQLEQQKMQTDAVHQAAKMQADAALEQQRFEHDKEMALLDHALKAEEARANIQHLQFKAHLDAAAKQAQMAAKPADGESQAKPAASEAIHQMVADHLAQHTAALTDAVHRLSAPRRIVRDDKGKLSHIETMT